ncbi:MAG: hypothetical protein C4532_06120 [Candidatus Abyssobacteria bacterium SURF_17]|jgi:hypothetical protein|uniref:IPT/TIG domain-containing protein n=1 Tax=Candidatus Abyssobacteria bacterium SURF_17 TaxID=2093361 RepID=A0A419F206_9BACT|nr:MAG: hypothetical protein C4532_06120 [Candidatus Abyssubacteria bacterium SURF_17]
MNKTTFFFVAAFSLFFSSSAVCAPQIAGTAGAFREGESVVINGSGFGAKSRATPLKWDNFESGAPDQLIPTADGIYTNASVWGNSIREDNLTFTNANNRPGSTLCSKNDMDDYYADNQRSAYLKWGTDVDSLKKIFVTFWARFTFGTDYQRHQVKFWRIESNSDDGMKFAQYNWGPQDAAHYYQRGTGSGGVASSHYFTGQLPYQQNQWFQIEFQAEQSDQGIANGSIEIWNSHVFGSTEPMVKIIDLQDYLTRSVPYYWDRVYIGEATTNLDHYVKSGVTNYFDNFYIDNSWARVVIGDASTYNACRRREVQIPSAWSDNSISVTVNSASLPYGTAYLYVVDGNGTYNANGYPITVEQSAKWLADVVARWQAGKLTRDDLNRAIYWYIKGTAPTGDPMAELTEEDIGNALKIVGQE